MGQIGHKIKIHNFGRWHPHILERVRPTTQEKITPHSKIIKTDLLAIYRGHCLHQRKLKEHLIL
jgi:hypothetical protein